MEILDLGMCLKPVVTIHEFTDKRMFLKVCYVMLDMMVDAFKFVIVLEIYYFMSLQLTWKILCSSYRFGILFKGVFSSIFSVFLGLLLFFLSSRMSSTVTLIYIFGVGKTFIHTNWFWQVSSARKIYSQLK